MENIQNYTNEHRVESPKKSVSRRSERLERAETTDYPLHIHNNRQEDPSSLSKDGDDFEQVVIKRYKLKRKNPSSKQSSPRGGFRDEEEEEDDSGYD